MNNTNKLAIGLGIASSALLAAWLFTGDRKEKSREFIAKKAEDLKRTIQKKVKNFEESESLYI
ncbi:MAG: hypothetical protein OEU76_01645 [Cyclobacteriaceae bacterium]|nr:hypothetical protein [Cyclobacteriaceae bacterium]